jgi:hypothetical protein
VAASAFAVESANIVGYDNSYVGGEGFNFVSGNFVGIGANTMDINQIQIPGAEWDGITFGIWEGIPTVRANSAFTYWDASNDPEGEALTAYWGDDSYNVCNFSIAKGQGVVLQGLEGYALNFAGEVSTNDVEIVGNEGFSFLGNPFPTAIDINAIQIPGAEWDGITFGIWEGIPTVRANSAYTYWDASNDPEGKATTAYWGDDSYNVCTYSIAPGQGFVLQGAEGYTVKIASPY